MTALLLGPMLRYVGPTEATIWVEVDRACEVEILGHRAPTFEVEGHHYALVYMTDLRPATRYEYTVLLDGVPVWPEASSGYPASVIHTFDAETTLRIAFGSCRVAMPHEPPYTLTHAQDEEHGFELDALRALACCMREQAETQWPSALLMIGDQVYADEVSPAVRAFIRARRDITQPPGDEIADFEEYTRLYRDAWSEPDVRWLLSTVPTAMIFDDHDVMDDWNISLAWLEEMRAEPWWHRHIVGGFMSYWIYQHLGNLSPRELHEDALFQRAKAAEKGAEFTEVLREFAATADQRPDSYRWSYYRDFGDVRLLVVDSRAGRMLGKGRRDMLDENEWRWIEAKAEGDFEHLLLGTSLPVLLGHGIHYLEAWNEAVCAGVWGGWFAKQGERIRRKLDLEHWSAFQTSFRRIVALIQSIAAGEFGNAPATVTVLSGDVHHVYLARAEFPGADISSAVYQAVCSPFRNPLDARDARIMRAGWSRIAGAVARTIAGLAGVGRPGVQWKLCHDEPWFDNQVAIMELSGREATIRFEKCPPGDPAHPRLEEVFYSRLARSQSGSKSHD
ncbi:MAG: alkaline phosphatase D family protein [Burkholderiaceae bacterium]